MGGLLGVVCEGCLFGFYLSGYFLDRLPIWRYHRCSMVYKHHPPGGLMTSIVLYFIPLYNRYSLEGRPCANQKADKLPNYKPFLFLQNLMLISHAQPM